MVDKYVNTDLEAGTRQGTPVSAGGGRVSPRLQGIAFTGTQADADVLRLFQVPSDSKLVDLLADVDALTGMSSVSVGLYYPKKVKSGAAISAACFASAISLASAAKRVSLTQSMTVAKRTQFMWEIAGLTKNPGGMFDIALTLNTAGSATGNLAVYGAIAQLG